MRRSQRGGEIRGPVPGEGAAVVVPLRGVGVESLAEAVGARVVDRRQAQVGDDGDRGHDQHHARDEERADGCELDLARLDLLPKVLRRPSHHQAGDEHGDQDVEEHPVEAGADAAPDHLAAEHVEDRHGTAAGRQRVVPAADRAVRGVRRRRGPEGGVRDSEAHLLVLHVAAALARPRRRDRRPRPGAPATRAARAV